MIMMMVCIHTEVQTNNERTSRRIHERGIVSLVKEFTDRFIVLQSHLFLFQWV